MKKNLSIWLLLLLGFQVNAMTYDEAVSIALEQQSSFQDEFEGRGDFVSCVMEAYEFADNQCERYDGIENFEPAVLEFNDDGKIVRVYSAHQTHYQICMSYELMKKTCFNPPLRHLFGIIETR